jgi:heat-inducible transcriptional repressor
MTGQIQQLNDRSRQIFQDLVETYLATGEPVGSRTLSKARGVSLSPASVRNIMADLEDSGLLYSPHTSAGRLPTEAGLRLFVDGMLEIGDLGDTERQAIEARCTAAGRDLEDVLSEATHMLSGLSQCAGLVMAPRIEAALKHIEFIYLSPGKALVVVVHQDNTVENRVIDVPAGMTPSMLTQASNYLSSRVAGRTIREARDDVQKELAERRAQLDELTAHVVEAGIAIKSGAFSDEATFIVRGHANLLSNVRALEDLERLRQLFEDLEKKRDLSQLLDLVGDAEGVRIFIGSENQLFGLSGSSLIISPYMNSQQKVVGVLGVVGPTRINYARIVPMVDYTARVVGKILE